MMTMPMAAMMRVPDRCFSQLISTANTPMMAIKGRMPHRRVCIFFGPKMVARLEKHKITAIFASSEGWKVPSAGIWIQRIAPFRLIQ